MSRCVLKAIIHRKKQWIVLRKFFFFKKTLFMILYMPVVFDLIIFPFYNNLFLNFFKFFIL